MSLDSQSSSYRVGVCLHGDRPDTGWDPGRNKRGSLGGNLWFTIGDKIQIHGKIGQGNSQGPIFKKLVSMEILLAHNLFTEQIKGYQSKFHVMYTGIGWSSPQFYSAVKFAKYQFLLNSFMKFGPSSGLRLSTQVYVHKRVQFHPDVNSGKYCVANFTSQQKFVEDQPNPILKPWHFG